MILGHFFDDVNFGVLMGKAGITRENAYTDPQICSQFGVPAKGKHTKRMYGDEGIKIPCRIGHYSVIHYMNDEKLAKVSYEISKK